MKIWNLYFPFDDDPSKALLATGYVSEIPLPNQFTNIFTLELPILAPFLRKTPPLEKVHLVTEAYA